MLKDYLRKITRISHTESIDNCNSNRLIDPHQVHTTSDFLRVPCLAGTLSNCCMFHAEQSCNHHFSSTKKRLSIMSTMTLKPSKGKVHYLIHSSHFMHCQCSTFIQIAQITSIFRVSLPVYLRCISTYKLKKGSHQSSQ